MEKELKNEAQKMSDKERAKENLKQILLEYHKYKNTDALYSEGSAEDLILDMFKKVLGWVPREDYIPKKSQNGKIPDFTFRLNGVNKFFLEVKRPSEDLDDPKYQKQAIGYARSSAVSFAVLTNLKEIRVYVVDREIDNVTSFERFKLFPPILIENCLNEPEFEKLWLLSKESFLTKYIYNFAEETCKLPKRKEINEQLSEKLNYLRDKIKSAIKKHERLNGKLLSDNNAKVLLEEVTQKILNRLVFIRMCEDRGFENKKLAESLNLSKNKKTSLWESILNLFRIYDQQNERGEGGYNSGLFKESLCDKIFIDDEILELVIDKLYYFDDGISIDFSKIPADVLGNLYEDYLSHISRNPETQKSHKKEQGIYYTPTYIVDYIVRNTLGELLKDKKVDTETIKILDPACGSGSFLIKAFDVLEEYHLKNGNGQTKLDTTGEGVTFNQRVQIIKNNLFGVDLDPKAVEIAQLNLLLKIADQRKKLPSLQENIKQGNSLIDDDETDKENYFKWVGNFQEGTFDVVIGNPPYLSATQISELQKNYFKKQYVAKGRLDTYILFIEKAITICKLEGYVGFIIPNKFLTNVYFKEMRQHILKNCEITSLVQIEDTVFKSAAVNSVILVVKKVKYQNPNNFVSTFLLKNGVLEKLNEIKQEKYNQNEDLIFFLESSKKSIDILQKIAYNSVKMGEICDVRDGIVAGRCKDVLFLNSPINKESKKIIFANDMGKYYLDWKGRYVDYRPDYMKKQEALRTKGKGIGIRLRIPEIFETEKIITKKTEDRIIAAYDEYGYYFEQTVHGTIVKNSQYNIKYLLGLLNSKLFEYYYKQLVKQSGTIFPQVRIHFLKKIPIKIILESQQQPLIKIVDRMLSLNKQLQERGDKKTAQTAKLEEEINKTDEEINDLVYKLYDITEEEKKIIKESLK